MILLINEWPVKEVVTDIQTLFVLFDSTGKCDERSIIM